MSSLQKSPSAGRHPAEAVNADAASSPRPTAVERRSAVRYASFAPHPEGATIPRNRLSRTSTQTTQRRSMAKRTSDIPDMPPVWSLAKRSLDVFGSLTLLVLLSPVLAALYGLVARSGDKVIYGHRRIGRNGEWFTCYKFRTMIPDAENVLKRVLAENPELQAEWDRDEKLRNDPRVTKIGEFLRRTSLDELPQLFNVLKGDMSLVGPRPATDVGKAHYGRAWRWYLAVRPGMTGLWQVSGRNDVGFQRRVVLDVYYIRNQSLLLDIQILFRTIRVVFGSTGY